jgi:hypothetical protein
VATKAILVLLTVVWISFFCGQTAFAFFASTSTDTDDHVINEEKLDIDDLGNEAIDAAIPAAIVSGSSYLVLRQLIRYYIQGQMRRVAFDEKKNQYRKFLDHVEKEIYYKSGKLQIKNPSDLSRNLHIWCDLTCLDLPVELNSAINNFIQILDKLPDYGGGKGEQDFGIDLNLLEHKLKEVKDSMCRDVQYNSNFLSKIWFKDNANLENKQNHI